MRGEGRGGRVREKWSRGSIFRRVESFANPRFGALLEKNDQSNSVNIWDRHAGRVKKQFAKGWEKSESQVSWASGAGIHRCGGGSWIHLFQSERLIVLAEQGVGFDNIDLRGGEEWGTKAALRERG